VPVMAIGVDSSASPVPPGITVAVVVVFSCRLFFSLGAKLAKRTAPSEAARKRPRLTVVVVVVFAVAVPPHRLTV